MTKRHPYLLLDRAHEDRSVSRELLIDYEEEKMYIRDVGGTVSIPVETSDISDHIANEQNPHMLDRRSVGLDRVRDYPQASAEDLIDHTQDTDNPHLVTKEHIGLGNLLDIDHAPMAEYQSISQRALERMNAANEYMDQMLEHFNIERHTLTLTVEDGVTARVFYNGIWYSGTSHQLILGIYQYELTKLGYGVKKGYLRMLNADTSLTLTIDSYGLTFETIPEEAEVLTLIDGVWKSGFAHNVPRGHYEYMASLTGYETYEGTVHVYNTDVVVPIQMRQLTYSVEIATIPSDAQVELQKDGIWREGNYHVLPHGEYPYIIRHSKYLDVEDTILVDSDKSITVNMSLKQWRVEIQTNVESPNVRIWIDGQWQYGSVQNLVSGVYQIEISKDEHQTVLSTISVYQDEIFTFQIQPEQLQLIVRTNPETAITELNIDDVWIVGDVHYLPPGVYEYRVRLDGYIEKTGTVTMQYANVILEINMEKPTYRISVTTNIQDAEIRILDGGMWIEGTEFDLEAGDYEIMITAPHMNEIEETISVSGNADLSYTLTNKLYQLEIQSSPIGVVEVLINSVWVEGNTHSLPYGIYDYRVSLMGYDDGSGTVELVENTVISLPMELISEIVTVTTVPTAATFRTLVNGIWTDSKSMLLKPGEYEYQIDAPDHNSESGVFDVLAEQPNPLSYTLTRKLYPVHFNVNVTAVVEVNHSGVWSEFKDGDLLMSGEYTARVSSDGYMDSGEFAFMIDPETIGIVEIPVTLIRMNHTLTFLATYGTANISVLTSPGVWVNVPMGTTLGEYPISIPIGVYPFVAKLQGFEDITGSVVHNGEGNYTLTWTLLEYLVMFNVEPVDISATHITGGSYSGDGNAHTLVPGMYDYDVSILPEWTDRYLGSAGSFQVTDKNEFFGIPLQPILYELTFTSGEPSFTVEILIDGVWTSGTVHNLMNGDYQFRANAAGYQTYEATATIANADKEQYIVFMSI